MKKLLIFAFFWGFVVVAKAQLVEHYDNPQRFQFFEFDGHDSMYVTYLSHTFLTSQDDDTSTFFSRRYSIGSNRVIYGVAIPVFIRDHYADNIIETPFDRWNKLINYYDTCGGSVILGNATQTTGYEYELLAKAHVRFGEAALTGNYFKMPDADSARLQINNNSTYFPVIEVYFDRPKFVSDSFIVGTILPPHQKNINGVWTNIFCGPFYFFNVGAIEENQSYATIVEHSYIITEIQHPHFPVLQENSWGGPFPIVTPPPCMPPVFMKVDEHHRKGVTISWRVQYGTAYSEVEYGPQGFAEGTGTLVGPIAPDADFNGHLAIDSLQMDADYTVRLRSFCTTTGGYSDWAEMDFHTGSFYIVSTSVNSDTCGEVKGGGVFPTDTTIKLYAYPRNHKPFLNWSDGSTQNPRIVTVTRDTAFHAIFDCGAGTGGGTDGIETAEASSIQVSLSPNPTDGLVALNCNMPVQSWSVLDMKGRTLKSASPASNCTSIDLSHLPPAPYIVSIRTNSGHTIRKIIVK